MKRERLYIVEDKRFDQARERCLMIIRNHFNNASWLDSIFEHQDNPEGLTYLMYMFKQFMETFYHNPEYRKRSVMRLAPLFCRLAFEANFQNNNPNDEVLTRLEQMLFYIYNSSINGKLDVSKISLDATYNDMETTFGEAIDELSRQEDDRMNNNQYNKNDDYEMVGPLSFEEANKYGNMSCPDSKLCYTQSENTWNGYTQNGKNNVYVFLKKGWEDLEPVHDGGYSGYDTYGLSMIFVFIRNGKLVYCNTRWNHKADYADGCSCDHALTKEMLSEIIGINFNELFKEVNIEDLLMNGTPLTEIFDYVYGFTIGDFYPVRMHDQGWNFININNTNELVLKEWVESFSIEDHIPNIVFSLRNVNNQKNYLTSDGRLLTDFWYDESNGFDDIVNIAIVKINEKGWCAINNYGEIITTNWYEKIYPFRRKISMVKDYSLGYNYINTNGEILSEQWFDEASSFSYNGVAATRVKIEGKGCNLLGYDGTKTFILFNQWYDKCDKFKAGVSRVKIEGKGWNYINLKNEYISDTWYNSADEFDIYDNIAKVGYKGKGWNYINTEGVPLTNEWYDYCFKNEDGTKIRVSKDGKCNYIDLQGNYLGKWEEDTIRSLYSNIRFENRNPHKKQIIRITESDFYNIIKESVQNIINRIII